MNILILKLVLKKHQVVQSPLVRTKKRKFSGENKMQQNCLGSMMAMKFKLIADNELSCDEINIDIKNKTLK